jgi:NAD(P)-dependent dehydrogenase (short-subunit alcohol dehydrogenase family)
MKKKLAVLAGAPAEVQKELANRLHTEGYLVVVPVRSERQAGSYSRFHSIKADLTDPGQVINFAKQLEELGNLHFVFDGFLPGPLPAEASLVKTPAIKWAAHLQTGLYTSVSLAQNLLPILNAHGLYLMLHNEVAEQHRGMASVVAAARLKLNRVLAAEQKEQNVLGYQLQHLLYLESAGLDYQPKWITAEMLAGQICKLLTASSAADATNPIIYS